MAGVTLGDKVNRLFAKSDWKAAERILESARQFASEDHWILTQLGVSLYEQHRYAEALHWLQKSEGIVGDCPLTLWNLAGTHAAMGKHQAAEKIYLRLLASNSDSEVDPCWESREWADSLKADCFYRLGLCYQQQSNPQLAAFFFNRYIDLQNQGSGTYSVAQARRQISLSENSFQRRPKYREQNGAAKKPNARAHSRTGKQKAQRK